MGAAQSARTTNAMRLPRRRSSVAPGIGSLEAESDIEDGGKRRKRIPLQRVAAMPIHAGIGTLPFAREAVLSVARLLDHERLKPEPEPLLLPLRHQVLAQRSEAASGASSMKRRLGATAMPSIVCTFSGVGTAGSRERSPAAIQPRLTRTWSSPP